MFKSVAVLVVMFVVLLGLSLSAAAMQVAGVDVEPEVIQADGRVLTLNGAGIRTKFFFKIYVASLYLEEPARDPAAVIQQDGGKRLIMHFLYSEVEQEDLVEAWNEGFSANLSTEQLAGLKNEIAAFNSLFSSVKEGDTVVLDYIPGQGTTVYLKNQEKGVVAGKAFNDALLSIWLGSEPVGDDLKEALLAGSTQ